MIRDPKKAALEIVTRLGPSKKPDVSDESEGGDEGLLAAAEELIAAVHAKDAARTVEALRAAFELCGAHDAD